MKMIARCFLKDRFRALVIAQAVFLVVSCVQAAAASESKAPATEFRQVAFDEGMKHQLNRSLPLTLSFPRAYEMLLLDPAIDGVVWGMPDELKEMKRTQTVPARGGFFHGRLTPNVGYDRSRQSFVCGPECDEGELENQLRGAGLRDIRTKKATAKGIPLLFVEADVPEGKGSATRKLYMAYIATLIDTNVMLISYRPPALSRDSGKAVWEQFKGALAKPD